MDITLSSKTICKTVDAPPSKSFVHRMLICASAADKPTVIECNSFSDDTQATLTGIQSLGAKAEICDGGVKIIPIKKDGKKHTVDCRESGSTLRFMLPFASALGIETEFIGADRLGKRPLAPLCEVLSSHGIRADYGENSFLPCRVSGKLSGRIFDVKSDISSQFVTGIMLSLAVLGGGEIRTVGKTVSGGYLDITADVLGKFGVCVKKTEKGFSVSGKLVSPERIKPEGDWSNAAFLLASGALGGEIKCRGIAENSVQGDCEFIRILRNMGGNAVETDRFITVKKSELHGIEADCGDIPDLVPILCVTACGAIGKSVFYNVGRLRDKESDRIKTTVEMIRSLGGSISADRDSITVMGNGRLKGGKVSSANDHRIAMSAAVASLICDGKTIICGAEAVNKSYPDFFEKFKAAEE